ncbi:corepressor interacting with RBPJ 1 [Cimex lectularius]|uniref:CBF1-interacting co-repressor CIR N-terminal domain-containing protein n=1 Tax=Cimex lectularius TaxID=79782 RepID=A0A8I6RZ40_CIMLE|nr:corepressor interacting with RBPJ 1 [Cimex lectularius]
MGKGFNNYMCKKFFHPASRDNLKRVWMAQQKDDAYKKKQDELRMQYEKEQDLYNNKAMLSKESKDKLSVNFMYEAPPGAKKEREKEDNEPEYKFEWQRKYNAPREDYCKGDSEIQDQPFGILVRNVRCIKCRKWGHINTDKECPLYNQSTVSEIATESSDALQLLRGMREDGLRLKKTALDAQQHVEVPRYKGMIPNDKNDDKVDDKEVEYLKKLSKKEKLKLLKKLEKLEKKKAADSSDTDESSTESSEDDRRHEKKKSKKKHLKIKKRREDEDSDSDDDEDSKKERKRRYKKKSALKTKKRKCKSNDSESDSESDSERRRRRKKNKKKHRENK